MLAQCLVWGCGSYGQNSNIGRPKLSADGHDNAVSEGFFQLLKRERIRRRVYATRDDARADVFNYIEMF